MMKMKLRVKCGACDKSDQWTFDARREVTRRIITRRDHEKEHIEYVLLYKCQCGAVYTQEQASLLREVK